jgi:hypothetical protein
MNTRHPWADGVRPRWARWFQVVAAHRRLSTLGGGSRIVSRDVPTPVSRAWHTRPGSPPSASPYLLGKRKSASLPGSLWLRRRGPLLVSAEVQGPTPPPEVPVPITQRGTGARRGRGPATVRRLRRRPRTLDRRTPNPGAGSPDPFDRRAARAKAASPPPGSFSSRSDAGGCSREGPESRWPRTIRVASRTGAAPELVGGMPDSAGTPRRRGPRVPATDAQTCSSHSLLPCRAAPLGSRAGPRAPRVGLPPRMLRPTTTDHARRAGGQNGWF